MSILRQGNWLGQARVDVPHLRALESSIAADFDVLAGRILAGGKPLVIRGFTLANFVAGTPATSLQLVTADSILANIGASESGTILWVPADRATETLDPATNTRVSGSFTASQANYIGLDLIRTADSSTADLVQFLDGDTLIESPKTVPLGRILDYRIVISTIPFSAQPNIVPVAKVNTNSLNQVGSVNTDVQDARNMAFRLGSGGDFPSRTSSFVWTQSRNEFNTVTGTSINQFSGADKAILSQKDWMDAMMSRVWEIGGGEAWYSPVADRNVYLARAPSPSVFASTGDNFEYTGGNLHWQGLSLMFENSNGAGVYYNTIADQLTNVTGLTNIVAGECIYVDVDRTQTATLTPVKAQIRSLGTPTIPGSRWIIAWCRSTGVIFTRNSPLPVNSIIQPATTTAIGGVRLSVTAGTPATPTVVPLDSNQTLNLGVGANGVPTGNNPALTVTGNSGTGYAATMTAPSGGGSSGALQLTGGKYGLRSTTIFGGTTAIYAGNTAYNWEAGSDAPGIVAGAAGAGRASIFVADGNGGVASYIRGHFPLIVEATYSTTGNSEIKGFYATNGDGGLGLRLFGGAAAGAGNYNGGVGLDVRGNLSQGSGQGGNAVEASGGTAVGVNGRGGAGIVGTGGNGTNTNAFGGYGGKFTGGNNASYDSNNLNSFYVNAGVGVAGIGGGGTAGGDGGTFMGRSGTTPSNVRTGIVAYGAKAGVQAQPGGNAAVVFAGGGIDGTSENPGTDSGMGLVVYGGVPGNAGSRATTGTGLAGGHAGRGISVFGEDGGAGGSGLGTNQDGGTAGDGAGGIYCVAGDGGAGGAPTGTGSYGVGGSGGIGGTFIGGAGGVGGGIFGFGPYFAGTGIVATGGTGLASVGASEFNQAGAGGYFTAGSGSAIVGRKTDTDTYLATAEFLKTNSGTAVKAQSYLPASGTPINGARGVSALVSDNGNNASSIIAGSFTASSLSSTVAYAATFYAEGNRGTINLNVRSTDPASPVNGDIWINGSAIKVRLNGVTRTFTVT